MTAQLEMNSRAAFAGRAADGEGMPELGAALVGALEQALLAANRLLDALEGASGRPTNEAIDQARVRQALTLIGPCGVIRPPSCGCSDALVVVTHAGSATPAPPAALTRREAEVLQLLAAGQSNHQIARALCLSPRTVQRHIANVYLKIGVHNRAEATAYALRCGLT